jgi:hypothetical protein
MLDNLSNIIICPKLPGLLHNHRLVYSYNNIYWLLKIITLSREQLKWNFWSIWNFDQFLEDLMDSEAKSLRHHSTIHRIWIIVELCFRLKFLRWKYVQKKSPFATKLTYSIMTDILGSLCPEKKSFCYKINLLPYDRDIPGSLCWWDEYVYPTYKDV